MTPKIATYIKGRVKIRIRGLVPERFINLCVAENILLWGLSRKDNDLYAWILLSDFFRIRPLVRKSHVKVTVAAYGGWPFIVKKLERRKMLVAGALFCIIAIQILASYIWFIDVSGAKTITPEQVLAVVYEQGLKPGTVKEQLDVKPIERAILVAIPQVSWVSINFHGTRAVVEIVEKTVPKPEDKTPAHIIADKDGIITEIIALAGQAAVKKGDTVKKGDLLIKGFAPDASNTTATSQPKIITVPSQLVKAKGIVKARIWYESYGETATMQEVRQRTGRQEMAVNLNLGGHQLVIKRGQPAFESYDEEVVQKRLPGWRNREFAVESTIRIYYEVDSKQQPITLEQARDEATGRALAAVQQLIPESAQILTRQIEILKLNENNLVRVKVGVETIEDIGKSITITQ